MARPRLSHGLVLLSAGAVSLAMGCGHGATLQPPGSTLDAGAPDASPNPPPGAPDAGADVEVGDAGQPDSGPTPLKASKVDLLFMIDNSASMGDKQAYLAKAIPDLLRRLVTPNCLDASGAVVGVAQQGGTCAQGTPELAPVHDMHIGVVSSSLGPRLGDQIGNKTGGICSPTATITLGGETVSQHNDDQAHLLTRAPTPGDDGGIGETPLPDAASGFLAWYPTSPLNTGPAPNIPITDPARLQSDFTDLVEGVHQYGCGIESQLESWYRFLVQPDPYASLAVDASQHATWVGVDKTILAQRHDFLRPDSAVVIVDLTDENDSEIDVRSVGGQGYLFMGTNFYPPRGTQACAANPADPLCTSCGSGASADPSCAQGPYNSPTDWGYDLNLRHVHMKAKYGVQPQFPVARYVNGLTSPTVPDRAGEYPVDAAGNTSKDYVGTNDCVNPLFAASLPDGTSTDPKVLCDLQPGSRTKDLVFFAHIGGVPHQLLHFDPTNPSSTRLSAADWTTILGNDPDKYDYTGIDPHMIESYQPRTGLPVPTSANGTDPISGREWITNVGPHLDLEVDREYACIFPLVTPRDCTQQDNRFACDCSSTGLTHDQTSPVCDPVTVTTQVAAKAYPTIRELSVARALGDHGIVASICPIDVVDNATQDDPLYGYRPAVSGIVNELKGVLVP